MTMTRKHVNRIASAVCAVKDRMDERTNNYSVAQFLAMQEVLAAVAAELAAEFRWQNPDFDKERFLKACGVRD